MRGLCHEVRLWKMAFEAEFCSKSFPIYYSNTYSFTIGIQDNIPCGGTVVTNVVGSGAQSAVVVYPVWICSETKKNVASTRLSTFHLFLHLTSNIRDSMKLLYKTIDDDFLHNFTFSEQPGFSILARLESKF